MINKNTLLVLGAGASKPYGFPTGAELRAILCAPITRDGSEDRWVPALLRKGVDRRLITEFSNAFLKSGVSSIDAFLARRSEYADLGKEAIAVVIQSYGDVDIFHRNDIIDHWYPYLWNQMISGVDTPNGLLGNRIRIVSFNYDKSLEYFLTVACSETFGLSEADSKSYIDNLEIVHIYGSLNNYMIFDDLSRTSHSIKIIPDLRSGESAEFIKAREFLSWAAKLCFLGFGFDALNVERLDFKSVLNERGQSALRFDFDIAASSYGKTDAEIEIDRRATIGSERNWVTYKNNCLTTLRESGLLLNQPELSNLLMMK